MKLETLVDYFDRELAYLRRAGAEFAHKYPKIAQRLQLQSTEVPDPHVERLIQSFAFLTARVQRKIDDDFPELSEALLSVLYPHYLAPIPSLCIAQFNADGSQGRSTEGQTIPRGTQLYSKPVSGTRCRFRTCFDVTLWPLSIRSAKVGSPQPELEPPQNARSVLTVSLETQQNISVHELALDSLRFYIHTNKRLSYTLLEFFLGQVSEVGFVATRDGKQYKVHAASHRDCIRPVGFAPEEELLPYDERSLKGYRYLLEYFAFPEKFLFFELCGLQQAVRAIHGDRMDVLFYSERPIPEEASDLEGSELRLGCAPLVNLFRQSAMPISLKHTQHEYCVVPDKFRYSTMEVYAIESARGVNAASYAEGRYVHYQPLYSTAHAGVDESGETFWTASRRQSNREGYSGTDVHIRFVNCDLDLEKPAAESVIIETLCSNGDLPASLPFGETRNDFNVEGVPAGDIRCLTKPTPTQRSTLGRGVQWRLISHLLVNLQSFIDPNHGRETLQEILTLYNFQNSAVNRQQIAGIVSVAGKPVAARLTGQNGLVGMARGVEITIEFDPEQYVGSSVYLFASLLERFLALYVSMNSFCKLSVKLKGQEGYLKRWPPRAGSQSLL